MPDTRPAHSSVLEPASTALPSCAVLVMSCDRYRDLWTPFFHLFWRYWPDCPFPVYLSAEEQTFSDPRVRSLQIGLGSWSRQLKISLAAIPADYVLLLLEDFFLTAPVRSQFIGDCLRLLDRCAGTVLRLNPLPGPDQPLEGSSAVGEIGFKAPYRVSLQAAIWHARHLSDLLVDDENIWQFEWQGTKRSQSWPTGFYASYQPVLSYRHVVERGQWFRRAARDFGRQQIGCDFSARPVMSRPVALKKAIHRFLKRLFQRRAFTPAPSKPEQPRVAVLTNFIPPYWKPVFDELTRSYSNLRILVSTPMEPNRAWEVDWSGLDVVRQKTVTLQKTWRHPNGFSEPLFIHLPLDTIGQLRSFRAEIVLSTELGFRTLLALLYATLYRSKLIIMTDVSDVTERGRGLVRHLLRRLLVKSADRIIVFGNGGVRYLRSLGVPDAKLFVTAYATDVERFAQCPLQRRPTGAHRWLYVGQLIERKGLVAFLSTAAQWAESHPAQSIEFTFAGDGPLRDRLANTRYPPNLHVRLLGPVPYPDLPHLYAEAGIFVFPTFADTWGLVVNEALASGLPVLGSTHSQAVEMLVADGENGWTFQPHAPGQTYAAIDRCLNTLPDDLARMRANARAIATQQSPAQTARQIAHALNSCLESSLPLRKTSNAF